ncbi:MAG TPA: DoxX family protein [Kofleriaceae bacterium]|jgi:putative oxidoreductase
MKAPVRIVVALLLLVHGIYGLPHPAYAALLVCALGLLVPRTVVPAAIGAMLLVALDLALHHHSHWFVLGGYAVDGEPGAEFHVLLLACLVGIVWRFDVIRIVSAAILLPHAVSPFLLWDVDGMRAWGHGMTHLGFPCGVALVWSIKGLELVSCIGRLAGRFVVPACLGHLLILVPGMWISQHWDWFVVGPGEGGIEYPILLSACAVATILGVVRGSARAGAARSALPTADAPSLG